MKRLVLALVASVLVVVLFFGLYTKNRKFKTGFIKVENKIGESLHNAADKVGIDYPNYRILDDGEIVVKVKNS